MESTDDCEALRVFLKVSALFKMTRERGVFQRSFCWMFFGNNLRNKCSSVRITGAIFESSTAFLP